MSKVLEYLEPRGFVIYEDGTMNNVVVHQDMENRMFMVSLNGKTIMMGGSHDFHPGCHGISFDFRGCGDLADRVHRAIRRKGKLPVQVTYVDWNWAE